MYVCMYVGMQVCMYLMGTIKAALSSKLRPLIQKRNLFRTKYVHPG